MIPVLIPLTFIPAIAIVLWIRNAEHSYKESWKPLLFSFLWGALIAASLIYFIEQGFTLVIANYFWLAVLIAPVVEECIKPLCLRFVKKDIDELEDGIIFGAVAGLGFAATENVLYGMQVWNEGLVVLLSMVYLRTIGSALLHASATALTGYGYSITMKYQNSLWTLVPYFILAITVHSFFNVFAYFAITINNIIGVVIAVVFAVTLMIWLRKRIVFFDRKHLTVHDDL